MSHAVNRKGQSSQPAAPGQRTSAPGGAEHKRGVQPASVPPRATRSISSRTSFSTRRGRLLSSHSCSIGRSICSAISSNVFLLRAAKASESSPKAAATWRPAKCEMIAGLACRRLPRSVSAAGRRRNRCRRGACGLGAGSAGFEPIFQLECLALWPRRSAGASPRR